MFMVRERRTTGLTFEMERINQMMRGLGDEDSSSCFIDVEDLQDSSDKKWLSKERGSKEEYTKFGSMRKLDL